MTTPSPTRRPSDLFRGLGGKAVGIAHRLPALAPADASACLPCLPERKPRLRRKAVLDHRAPQDQDIHARIGTCGERIARQSRSGTAGPAPWLHPWKAPRLQLGRSEEHTSELQSLMRISYAVFCLTKKTDHTLHSRPTANISTNR